MLKNKYFALYLTTKFSVFPLTTWYIGPHLPTDIYTNADFGAPKSAFNYVLKTFSNSK